MIVPHALQQVIDRHHTVGVDQQRGQHTSLALVAQIQKDIAASRAALEGTHE